jgi:hypothetical protein
MTEGNCGKGSSNGRSAVMISIGMSVAARELAVYLHLLDLSP